MPLSYLTWTRAGRPWARAAVAARARKSSRQTATSEPAASADVELLAVSAPIVSSGTCGRRRPIWAASAPVATASRVAPPASAAVGAGVGAVAVAVGLDHRAELGPLAHRGLQPGAVALDCAEVDPGDCPRHRLLADERGQRVGPGDHAREAPVAVDHRQVVVVLLGDLLRDRLGVVVAVTTTGSAVIRSRTLVAKALLSRSSKPFIEPTKTIPPMMLR